MRRAWAVILGFGSWRWHLAQVKMIENALTIGARTVGQAMTPYELMRTVAADTCLDAKAIARIVKLVRRFLPRRLASSLEFSECNKLTIRAHPVAPAVREGTTLTVHLWARTTTRFRTHRRTAASPCTRARRITCAPC